MVLHGVAWHGMHMYVCDALSALAYIVMGYIVTTYRVMGYIVMGVGCIECLEVIEVPQRDARDIFVGDCDVDIAGDDLGLLRNNNARQPASLVHKADLVLQAPLHIGRVVVPLKHASSACQTK